MNTRTDRKPSKPKWCCECRAGEHENIDDDTVLYIVRQDGKMVFRGYLCSSHVHCRLEDGFTLTRCN